MAQESEQQISISSLLNRGINDIIELKQTEESQQDSVNELNEKIKDIKSTL